jgi:hypothetical protein
MSLQLLSQEEMMSFYSILEKWAERTPHTVNPVWFRKTVKEMRKKGVLSHEKYIDMFSFLRAREEMDPRIQSWLSMGHYWTFMKESDDRVFLRLPIIHLFNYVMKKVWLRQTRIGFMSYDLHGKGYLTEDVSNLNLCHLT